MASIGRPTGARIRTFLESQRAAPLTYGEAGLTRREVPPGFVRDHHRVRLGEGRDAFALARDALRRWEMFRSGWTELHPPDAPIVVGTTVAIAVRALGLWSLNACRIVEVIEEPGDVERLGFAYGTLPGHAESGEERFQVEWNRGDGAVWYDVLAVSRPRSIPARLGRPLVRRLQLRFARDQLRAMQAAVRTRRGG